jgi:elongation factor 2 kinase
MRECFRMKKLSSFTNSRDWKSAYNYVAKKYIAEIERHVVFEVKRILKWYFFNLQDVRLQMDAKLWAEEYNRHNPPKQIDIAQMCILEFIDRPGAPLYHMEHFIEGDYIKYNSNSGFVSELARQTPHVRYFPHSDTFTFTFFFKGFLSFYFRAQRSWADCGRHSRRW